MKLEEIKGAAKARRDTILDKYVGSEAQRPMKCRHIARDLGLHVGSVYKVLAKAGWPKPYGSLKDTPKRRAVRMLYKHHHWSVRNLAEAMSISEETVEKIIEELASQKP